MTQTNQPSQQFYTKDQLCRVLQVSRPTLQKYFRDGKLPDCGVSFGKKTLYPCTTIDAAIASMSKGAANEK